MKKPHHQRAIGTSQAQSIVDLLAKRRCTADEISAETGIYISRLNGTYLPRLRGLTGQPRRIFISAFVGQKGRPPAVYALGNVPDTKFVPKDKATRIARVAAPAPTKRPVAAPSWAAALGL